MHDLALARSIYSLYRIELNTYYIVLAKKQLSLILILCNIKDPGNTNVCHFPPLVDPAVFGLSSRLHSGIAYILTCYRHINSSFSSFTNSGVCRL